MPRRVELHIWDAWQPRRVVPTRWDELLEIEPARTATSRSRATPSGRALEVTATVKAGSPGVIVAQGGSAHGYALLIDKQHHLVFCFRRNGKLTRVVSPDRLPDGTLGLGARLDRQGGLQISIAGKVVARGKAAGPLTALPADGLQVGRDTGGSVGNYVTPNPFAGVIERVVIQLP